MEGDIACGHWTGNAEAWEGKGLVCGWVSASRAPFLKVQGRNVLGKVCVCSLSDAGGNTPLPVCKCVSGREVGTMELLALGCAPRQGFGSALHTDSEQAGS